MRRLTNEEKWILRELAERPMYFHRREVQDLLADGLVAYQSWHNHYHILDAGRAALAEISESAKDSP